MRRARSCRCRPAASCSACFPTRSSTTGSPTIAAGDRLLLYTDGITEARSPDDEEFGEARLGETVARHRHLDAAALHAQVFGEVTAFASGGFEDDATLLVVAVK